MTPERVREIAALADRPVLRNLLITHGYHRLTLAMAQLFGQDDFTWPIFATWASKQAGQFIREDELGVCVSALLAARAPEMLDDVDVRAPIRAVLGRIGRHVIGGNTIVFEELGEAFAMFSTTFADPAARTEERLAEVVGRFAEGPSLPDLVAIADDGSLIREQRGGQSLVREALGFYFAALHERGANARAELVLLGNGLCGLHEQIRLQPYIAGALEAPLAELAGGALGDRPRIAAVLAAVVRAAATEMMMTLALPRQVLRLGFDLPAPPGQPLWPDALARLEHPRLVLLADELGAYEARERRLGVVERIGDWLLDQADLDDRFALGSGADDWSRLADRMRYIFEFFRSRQRDASLLVSPFSEAQALELAAERVPAGPL